MRNVPFSGDPYSSGLFSWDVRKSPIRPSETYDWLNQKHNDKLVHVIRCLLVSLKITKFFIMMYLYFRFLKLKQNRTYTNIVSPELESCKYSYKSCYHTHLNPRIGQKR